MGLKQATRHVVFAVGVILTLFGVGLGLALHFGGRPAASGPRPAKLDAAPELIVSPYSEAGLSSSTAFPAHAGGGTSTGSVAEAYPLSLLLSSDLASSALPATNNISTALLLSAGARNRGGHALASVGAAGGWGYASLGAAGGWGYASLAHGYGYAGNAARSMNSAASIPATAAASSRWVSLRGNASNNGIAASVINPAGHMPPGHNPSGSNPQGGSGYGPGGSNPGNGPGGSPSNNPLGNNPPGNGWPGNPYGGPPSYPAPPGNSPGDVGDPMVNPPTGLPSSTVPEPVSTLLIGTGLAALGAFAKRRRRN